jgi:hypothetical protein
MKVVLLHCKQLVVVRFRLGAPVIIKFSQRSAALGEVQREF